MTVPPVSSVKSRPVFATIALDPAASHHLVVAGPGSTAVVLRLLDEAARSGRATTLIAPTGLLHTLGTPRPGPGGGTHACIDVASTIDALRAHLVCARMGIRIYATGSESFLADCRNALQAHGVLDDEATFELAGSLARPVVCIHCSTRTPTVTTDVFVCAGCARHLMVRDHYSRRLAAFMGVNVDAETPGTVPAPREVFP